MPFVGIPVPEMETIAVAVIFFLAGMAVPTYYGIERLEGFGRWMAAKLPYQPPPGMEEGEALEEAVPDSRNKSDDEEAEG